ncbi:MAG: hypothetical protein K6F27_08560 [Ruminococcus sp.]|nr:hypothetical protein [Ruminococcus sp.]
MTKKIITALLALTMLFMTACGEDNSTDTSKAETTTTAVTEQDNSEIDSSSDSEETTTTTADTTITTSDTSSKKEEKTTTNTKATTKATTTTKAVATTTKQAVVTTQATYTYKPVQTTRATTRATTKATTKATQATRATQPAKNKSALDLAYEAVILGTSTKAQRDLICNDLNNYVISKGYSKKLDKSLYALSDANGKPVEDVTKATGWGNCGYFGGACNSDYTTAYLLGKSTLEKAREDYKIGLRNNTDYCAKSITKKNGYAFNIVMYKDVGNAVQRLDLKYKYSIPRFTLVLCYH